MANEIAHKTAQQGEIILYQPDKYTPSCYKCV